MEIIPCPLCTSTDYQKLFMSRDEKGRFSELFYIVRCDDCGLVYLNPRPAEADKMRLYEELAGGLSEPLPEKDAARAREKIARLAQPFYRLMLRDCRNYKHLKVKIDPLIIFKKIWARIINPFIFRDIPPFKGEGRILDIGCNNGLYLSILKSIGWKVLGVELNPALAQAQEALGIEVKQGTLEDAQFEEGSFDVVRLSHVLEHLYEPLKTLKEIAKILKPNGQIRITVPNQRSFAFFLFKDLWYGAPGHLYCFKPFTLSKLCEKAGLTLERVAITASKGTTRSLLKKYLTGSRKNPRPSETLLIKIVESKLGDWLIIIPLYLITHIIRFGDSFEAVFKKTEPTAISNQPSASNKVT